MTDPFNLYPPIIQHMKDLSENNDEFIAEVVAYAGRLEEDHRRLQYTVNSLSKDKERLDTLETILKEDECVTLRYTDAWAECGEMGAVLSQGPEEFWINDDGISKYICKNLREAIDIYASKLRP